MADDERRTSFQSSPPTQWGSSPHIYPHSHHGTPAQEYSGFSFSSPHIPLEPNAFGNHVQHRPMHPQLQPLVMPQWPSMLTTQSHAYQPLFAPAVQPVHSIHSMQPVPIAPLQTPISGPPNRVTATPRKALTDSDRRRMCQCAEENPGMKQTEIGALFGVERSTVSKVLRQKEKYMVPDEGSRSPAKRIKGRSPDVEKALSVWAKNQEKKGLPLSDDLIRDKARAFVATTNDPDNHQVLTSSWIEKFKLNHNLLGARSRKSSLAPDEAERISAAASSSHTPNGNSPVSPQIGSPSSQELHSAASLESLKNESPDSYIDFSSTRHGPFHSQSTNSLNSAFTDTAPSSSFSPGPLSPFFTPDSGTASSPFVPPLTARPILPASTSNNSQRPRSQTFPLLDQYMSADEATPKYRNSTILDSPMEEAPDPLINIEEALRANQPQERPHTVTPSETMRPPPLPAHILASESKRELTPATSTSSLYTSTTPEDARQALEVVMSFIEQQPSGFLDLQEALHMGKLMEKLRLQSRTSS